ncbi:hypothetical protein [Caulobacter sp.]|uniref:hypothetical protein n=1 Tax=Caulobacter sp. TaxID=78 RepID=UPI003BAC542A
MADIGHSGIVGSMQRTSPAVITGWRAILLAPIALPLALLFGLWPGKKTVDRTANEVVGFLRDFLDNSGGQWDWDEFESVPITDPELENIRLQATTPGADLHKILEQAESLVEERPA